MSPDQLGCLSDAPLWPQSVQRHPEYMKLLAGFDRTWAISEATRRDFTGFWRWQGVTPKAPVEVSS